MHLPLIISFGQLGPTVSDWSVQLLHDKDSETSNVISSHDKRSNTSPIRNEEERHLTDKRKSPPSWLVPFHIWSCFRRINFQPCDTVPYTEKHTFRPCKALHNRAKYTLLPCNPLKNTVRRFPTLDGKLHISNMLHGLPKNTVCPCSLEHVQKYTGKCAQCPLYAQFLHGARPKTQTKRALWGPCTFPTQKDTVCTCLFVVLFLDNFCCWCTR